MPVATGIAVTVAAVTGPLAIYGAVGNAQRHRNERNHAAPQNPASAAQTTSNEHRVSFYSQWGPQAIWDSATQAFTTRKPYKSGATNTRISMAGARDSPTRPR